MECIRHLENDNSKEFETNQGLIGFENAFCRHIVKAQTDANFNQDKYHKLNKTAVQLCIIHYHECWIDRNKSYHEEEFQRERIMKWHQKAKEAMINSPCQQIKAFVQQNQLDTERVKNQTMQRQTCNAKEIAKKADEKPKNDMRRHYEELN